MYNLVSLHVHGASALINQPQKLLEYLEMLEDDETKERIQSFLAGKNEPASQFQGVTKKCCKKRYWYFSAQIKGADIKKQEKLFPLDHVGSEIRAAMCYVLWRLQLIGPHMTLNFERMRPVYLYLIATFKDQAVMVEKAYKRIGGDRFARALKDQDNSKDTPKVLGKRKAE